MVQDTSLAENIFVEGLAMKGASCAMVRMPPVQTKLEAHLIAVVLGADLEAAAPEPSRDAPLHYFTLESAQSRTAYQRALVCEWKADRTRRNYGVGPRPNVEDFAEIVEKIWVSRIC